MIRLILALLVFIAPCAAEPRYWGIDHLGGSKYAKEIIQHHPDGFALGIFTQRELFGDGYRVVDAALAKRKIPLVRFNLRWSDTHSFSRRDFPAIVEEAKRGLYVVNNHPGVECEYSGATEHQLTSVEASELAARVLAVIPARCVYVNNPWNGRGAFLPPSTRIKNEVHGGSAQAPTVGGRFNFSFDGTDSFDVDITKTKHRLSNADVFFFWTSQNNGRRNANDSTPRPQRKFWPTAELIQAMAFLATAEGPVSLPARYTAKPKSDQHEVPPKARELKPVLILPPRVARVELVADNGKLVAVSGGANAFEDGRYRYYFPEFGYQIAQKAIRLHGKPTVSVRVGGKKVGRFNPAFRAGSFR